MESTTILITGANGEIGHGLIPELSRMGKKIITLDIKELDEALKPFVYKTIVADILNKNALETIFREYKITTIFHLAAILSTSGEKSPDKAHEVNVNGTFNLLEAAQKAMSHQKGIVKFIFPSTIAVYGIPNLKTKMQNPKVKEEEFNTPITMYGINKLYCERLGIYYSKYYKLLDNTFTHFIDFRCIRFPGIISAVTIPSGGTSDFASEMIHSAAKGKPYQCFVREDTQIPFMVMPDAIKALLQILKIDKDKLSQNIYNVSAFSVSASQISKLVKDSFPNYKISYKIDPGRQRIVDSWPADIDDSKAKKDWGWTPNYNTPKKAFSKYLIPEIKKQYQQSS